MIYPRVVEPGVAGGLVVATGGEWPECKKISNQIASPERKSSKKVPRKSKDKIIYLAHTACNPRNTRGNKKCGNRFFVRCEL